MTQASEDDLHWRALAETAYEGFLQIGADHRVIYASPRWN